MKRFVTVDRSALLLVIGAMLLGSTPGWGRIFRPDRIPNGNVLSCANCHVSPLGGGSRTAFGNRVFQLIGGSFNDVAFWTPAFAAEDTDGDGRTNGEELGDPDGDGIPTAGAVVSHPGNRPPGFNSEPGLQATNGVAYQYVATATNPTANTSETIRFALVEGPAWLSMTTTSTSATLSGTPTGTGTFTVALTVRDGSFGFDADPYHTRTQQFDIVVTGGTQLAGFALWQAENFDLPAEAAIAEALDDPDSDGMPNLVEYALRHPPKTAGTFPLQQPTFDGTGRLQLSIDLRDDDPKLTAVLQVADGVDFAGAKIVGPVVSDPTPGDGFHRLSFTDTVSRDGTSARLAKIEIQLMP